MEKTQTGALNELAIVICENTEDEAAAVKGYQKQLAAIECAVELTTDSSELEALERLKSATEEKIADELNHAHSLLEEYEWLTGITPKKE